MEDTAPLPLQDSPTAEKALFLISALTGVLGLTVFASMAWESSPYRNGTSDMLVPISILTNFIFFPLALTISLRLYKECRDTLSKTLRTIIIIWHTISLLAWCLAIGVALLFLIAWLNGSLMWHGEVPPPSWSPLASRISSSQKKPPLL